MSISPSITGEDEASKSFITTRLAAMPGQARPDRHLF